MIFGTAGFTAMYVADQINKDKKKTILITGSNGGVGLISLYILSKFGSDITAITRRGKMLLKKIGAKKVINYDDFLEKANLPFLKPSYDYCIDNVGGEKMALILNNLKIMEYCLVLVFQRIII